jgi:hypothetical protein
VFLRAFYSVAVVLRKTWRLVSYFPADFIKSSEVSEVEAVYLLFLSSKYILSSHLAFLGWISFAVEEVRIMPPVLHLPIMNPTPTKRLGLHYPPNQGLLSPLSQDQSSDGQNGQHVLPARPASLTPNSQGFPSPRRSLPSKDVTDGNFDDAYINFVMYCNPAVPPDTDTTELRKIFRGPPKSDGKTFSTFTLFELIRKLDQKEIRTWAQLAIDLGVEPPSLEKGQSAQKVQQYAVRLKVSRFYWQHPTHLMKCCVSFQNVLGNPIHTTQLVSSLLLILIAMDACHACGCFLRVSIEQTPRILYSSTSD